MGVFFGRRNGRLFDTLVHEGEVPSLGRGTFVVKEALWWLPTVVLPAMLLVAAFLPLAAGFVGPRPSGKLGLLYRLKRLIIGAVGPWRRFYNDRLAANWAIMTGELLCLGLPLPEAMTEAAEALAEPDFAELAKAWAEGVGQGRPLSQALDDRWGIFPRALLWEISLVEASPELPEGMIEAGRGHLERSKVRGEWLARALGWTFYGLVGLTVAMTFAAILWFIYRVAVPASMAGG